MDRRGLHQSKTRKMLLAIKADDDKSKELARHYRMFLGYAVCKNIVASTHLPPARITRAPYTVAMMEESLNAWERLDLQMQWPT